MLYRPRYKYLDPKLTQQNGPKPLKRARKAIISLTCRHEVLLSSSMVQESGRILACVILQDFNIRPEQKLHWSLRVGIVVPYSGWALHSGPVT